jgi:hypothetical protein
MDPKQNEAAPAQEPQHNPEDMVEIHEASLDDLDAAIANSQLEEQAQAASEQESETDESASQKPEIPQGQADQRPQGQEPAVAAQGADPSKPQKTYTEEEVQGLIAENAQRKKEGNQKELFIQNRGNELGKVRGELAASRKELQDIRARLSEGLDDRWTENPTQAANDRDRIKDIDAQLQENSAKEERAVRIVEAQTDFLRHIDTDQVSLDDMAEVLKADGVPDPYISAFKANPWEFTTSEALVQMGRRAMDRKNFTQADADRKILAKHVLHLNTVVEGLKKRPGQVMAQVQKSLSRSPEVTARQQASPRSAKEFDTTIIPTMSDDDLNAALKSAMH